MNLSGQAAIVTGGASGMGAHTARALIEAGAKVAMMDVQVEQLRQVAEEAKALAVECDVTSAESAGAGTNGVLPSNSVIASVPGAMSRRSR